ncbi:tRNA N(3)-methylcytidine methyltransferase METTL2-like [Tigriopus californicus]|uniref:tRNA N(3)-methylcytidine methyltransferase METTL2-like n=1 Tax=Tigriopus californicus TaxID=6832 RepID=UPI0027DA6DE9|nr:tRNA N(3)-methylcytidine methyltransferase METTL2-like [Tigriopus californicus]
MGKGAPSIMEASADHKRPAFGNRFLTDEQHVFEHNAWDNVDWDADHLHRVQQQIEDNSHHKMSSERRQELEDQASRHWDQFYQIHQNRFFKDRKWLFTEFPPLAALDQAAGPALSMLEVGCGVGNTVFPVLEMVQNARFKLYCCDFSPVAIDVLKADKNFDPERCLPFVCDIGSMAAWQACPIPAQSLDVVTMIFCLSALEPEQMGVALSALYDRLKPGGCVLFRDYGQYDLAQVRFKPGKCLADNFYVRGDGTRVFFFSQDKVKAIFEQAGFVEKQNLSDKRLQVNRGKQLKMYRVWIQAQYVKPHQ